MVCTYYYCSYILQILVHVYCCKYLTDRVLMQISERMANSLCRYQCMQVSSYGHSLHLTSRVVPLRRSRNLQDQRNLNVKPKWRKGKRRGKVSNTDDKIKEVICIKYVGQVLIYFQRIRVGEQIYLFTFATLVFVVSIR